MASSDSATPRHGPSEETEPRPDIETLIQTARQDIDDLPYEDCQTRKVQMRNGGPEVNLTDYGKRRHGLVQSKVVRVLTFDWGQMIIPVVEGDD